MTIKDDTNNITVTTSVTLTGAPSDVKAIKRALLDNGVVDVDSYSEMIKSVVYAVDRSINIVKSIDITISNEDVILITVIDVEQLAELNSHRDFEVRYKAESLVHTRVTVLQSRLRSISSDAPAAYEPNVSTSSFSKTKEVKQQTESVSYKKYLKPTLFAAGVTLIGFIAFSVYKQYKTN